MDKKNREVSSLLINGIKTHELDFIKLINHRLGIVIHPHQTNELVKTLVNACQMFHCDAAEYLHMLKKAPAGSELFEHLIAGITVNETYFFRDKQQMELLQQTLLPQLIQSKRSKGDLSLRIWSAGCATGEEIYTLCMILLELLPDIKAWRLHCLGTDLNTSSLQKAMTGHYTEWSMRSISDYFKRRYFSFTNNHYVLADHVRDLVNFTYLNLNDKTYPSLFNGTNAQDLILCRNVLIYFDAKHINHLMKKLSDSLAPGGYLMLGASDPVVIQNTDLIFNHQLGLLFSRPTTTSIAPTPKKPVVVQPVEVKIEKKPILPPITKKIIPVALSRPPPSQINLQQIHTSTAKLINERRWQEVINVINDYEATAKKDSPLLTSKAMAYANLGQLEQSIQSCRESIALDVTNKDAYFTFALTLIELNRLDEAEEAFRKTLFLDRHFVVGHFQLGLLLFRKKQYQMGLKSLTNALTIATAKEPLEVVPASQGLNYGQLSEIFKHEIEMYAGSTRIMI